MSFWLDRTTTDLEGPSVGIPGTGMNQASTFEKSLSLLTLVCGNLEKSEPLTKEQLERLRLSVIRLSNCERKAIKGLEGEK